MFVYPSSALADSLDIDQHHAKFERGTPVRCCKGFRPESPGAREGMGSGCEHAFVRRRTRRGQKPGIARNGKVRVDGPKIPATSKPDAPLNILTLRDDGRNL